ncbi:MAG: acyltransferase [Actinobacteria bacterium]|nr:acyltransferase [Actinomycetota bacterium]MBU1493944.1 acyltransferase [Actinomycetota bacterium]
MSLRRLAEQTPPDRDRYVDFLRGFSILVVVLGHWLIAVVTWQGGQVTGSNALEQVRILWVATWVLQVMPLFFFVGGFSNLRSWRAARRKGGGYPAFLHGRLARMMRPTVVFLGIGLVATVTLDALNVADNVVFPASELITRPLWFLGVYMIVVALAPLMISLHERFGWKAAAGLALVAVLVDVVRFGFDIGAVGYVNYPVVWLLAHQMGFLYADGTLTRRVSAVLAIGGVGAMIALVALGPYPGSMVGLSTDEFSNMDPPTLAILALILWQIGLAMLLRDRVSGWLAGVRAWAGVIFVNSVIMTMFLWHLTAMLLGIGILYPIGFPQPGVGTASWWLLRPVWIAVLLVLLGGFVILFGRFEQRGILRSKPPLDLPSTPAAVMAAVLGAVMLVMGVLGFAMGGMHQLFSLEGTDLIVFSLNPFHNVLHLLLGGLLMGASVRSAGTVRLGASAAAIALMALAVVGTLMEAGEITNRLAANRADNLFHSITTLAAFGTAAGAGRRTRRGGVS